MNRSMESALYICFPATIWLLIGTALLFVLYKLEWVIESLGKYSQFPFVDDFEAREWHREAKWITALFLVTSPILTIRVSLLLFYAILAAALRLVYKGLAFVWKRIGETWEAIVGSTKGIANWAKNLPSWKLSKVVDFIWKWTCNSVESAWEALVGGF